MRSLILEQVSRSMHNRNAAKILLFQILIAFFSVAQATAIEWKLQHIPLKQHVTAIYQPNPDQVFVESGEHWYEAVQCKEHFCLKKSNQPAIARPSGDNLPDGSIATYQSSDLVFSAWYGQPTNRYGHGILGDRIEGGSLFFRDKNKRVFELQLPSDSVFEDLTPRLVDLDGDGSPEIITIKSFLDAGASIAVFGLRQDKLVQLAATPAIGRSNRWLNVAGIGDFNGDGAIDIAIVITPHIGGTLEIWSYMAEKLQKISSEYGFSNHFIGSRNLNLSAISDVNGDAIPDMAVPGAYRRKLRIMTLKNNRLSELATVEMPATITENIGILQAAGDKHTTYLLGLSDGRLFTLSKQ